MLAMNCSTYHLYAIVCRSSYVRRIRSKLRWKDHICVPWLISWTLSTVPCQNVNRCIKIPSSRTLNLNTMWVIILKIFQPTFLILKKKNRLMRSPCCLCIPPIIFRMSEPIFMKFVMYSMTPTSTACFLNSFHQSVCLYVYLPIVVTQRLDKNTI
jgi:hypothetical protein